MTDIRTTIQLLIVFTENAIAEADLGRRVNRAVKAASDDNMHRCRTGTGALAFVFMPASDAQFAALRKELADPEHPLDRPHLLCPLDTFSSGTLDGIAWARTQRNRLYRPQ